MRTRIASALAAGTAAEAVDAVSTKVTERLEGAKPKLMLAFASTAQPLAEVARLLSARFPGTVTLAASTAGEFTEAGDAKGSLALFALDGDYRVFSGLGEGLRASPRTP